MLPTIILLMFTVTPLFAAVGVRYIHGTILGWALAIIPTLLFGYFIHLIPYIMHNETIYSGFSWFSALGINFSFYVDGLSLLFALLISGIGIPIVIYSSPYLGKHLYLSRYYIYLFLFMASMLGLVLSDNLITLFIFWELTSISSYLLIGINHQQSAARDAALKTLFVTVIGGLSLLASFILIGIVTHTYSLAIMLSQNGLLQHHPLFIAIFLLMLIGAFTKSAQFPFHFWLPAAMEAPTPVSAYLHSATMVQGGVYLLARFHPLMSHSPWWFTIITAVGGLTMITGVVMAAQQNDMKLLLAYTTVTALGSLIFLLGSTNDTVIKAAVAFLVAHALYKATLFMAIGDIQHQTKTRDIREVRGLHKAMPITFMAVLISGASMAGIPPLLGFYVKELVYEANLAIPVASQALIAIAVLSNMLMAMLAFVLIIKPFWGKQKPTRVLEANVNMSVNTLLLALLMLTLSIFPFLLNHTLLSPAASAILSHPVKLELTLWHGFTPSLVLSTITLLGAIILYLKRNLLIWLLQHLKIVFYYGPDRWYHTMMQLLLKFSNFQTELLQNGKLRIYLTVTFLTIATLLSGFLIEKHVIQLIQWKFSISFFPLLITTWILVSAFMTLWARNYFIGLVFLGTFGIGVALFFLVNAAPDVAMTQALVETLIVIIVVFNLYRQPALPNITRENRRSKLTNIIIALVSGLVFSLLLLTITQLPFPDQVSQYYIDNSLPLGHGRNIVNVILVDFRAFDTLGEIIVIAIAAVGVYGLLKNNVVGGK